MEQQISILIVVPAYKECTRLPEFLRKLAEEVDQTLPSAEILVVDDGSGEAEQEQLRGCIQPILSDHLSILPTMYLPSNLGKGGAILAGWDNHGVRYQHLGFVDADGAVGAGEVCRLAAMLKPDGTAPALFATRIRMLGREVGRTGLRHFSGRLFAAVVGLLIHPGVYDSQCGLKFVPSTVFRRVRPFLKGHRFAFDVELLAGLLTAGCPIKEVPIDWNDIPGSKVSLVRDTVRMVKSVIQIRMERKKWTL